MRSRWTKNFSLFSQKWDGIFLKLHYYQIGSKVSPDWRLNSILLSTFTVPTHLIFDVPLSRLHCQELSRLFAWYFSTPTSTGTFTGYRPVSRTRKASRVSCWLVTNRPCQGWRWGRAWSGGSRRRGGRSAWRWSSPSPSSCSSSPTLRGRIRISFPNIILSPSPVSLVSKFL